MNWFQTYVLLKKTKETPEIFKIMLFSFHFFSQKLMMGLRTTFSKLIGSMEPNRTHANGAPDLLCILEEEGYKDTEKLGGKGSDKLCSCS